MELSALLLLVLVPAVANGYHNDADLPAELGFDVATAIDRLRSEIRTAVREEVGVVTKRQQHVVANMDDERVNLTKLTNDIITAMRDEIWAVNQMQLAAFYENHVLPVRKADNEPHCCIPAPDPPPIYVWKSTEGPILQNGAMGHALYPAVENGRNEDPAFMMKQATGAKLTPRGGFEMPWERKERAEEQYREKKRKPRQLALATGLVLFPLALLLFGLTIWFFLQHHKRQISQAWKAKRRE